MFKSKSQAILMGIGFVPTQKLCPSIPTWKQYPPMNNNIERTHAHPKPKGMGMGMGMGT
jgi:hypothetical protein